ncbi:MAG: MBL fold metallo-hydrolase [Chitinivibrionales bacterium]|nr:MBL fold metallo-hydrolase [Chitinivibrionales bacterium]MBD3396312.1 MBL fold metallo-hydrolase [Chitinivibrionales bacterium]
MKLTFLGTGTSHGVPSIDCMIHDHARCRKNVCREALRDPLHNRTRCSATVEYNGRCVLIDVSSDFRRQMLREQVKKIDAVLITHCHADHIGGIPDIRSYTRDASLPFYGSAESMDRIRRSYEYVFDPPEMRGGGIPDIELHQVEGPFELFGCRVTPVPVEHGSLRGAFGYRLGDLAYIPDAKQVPDAARGLLAGVRCLVLDALRDERPHSTHLILPESIALARDTGADQTYFTHMCHDIHYRLDSALLDTNMSFAHDGLVVQL